MTPIELRLPERSAVPEMARTMARAEGRLVVVGGWIRDRLLGETSSDLDLEVFGLTANEITAILRPFEFSPPVGRHFPTWRQSSLGIDVSLPQPQVELDSNHPRDSLEVAFRSASRRRDLTVNAIGWDPLGSRDANSLIDPWRGLRDLEARRLRAVDLASFGSDPLRVFRVARLAAQMEAEVDPELILLCRALVLDAVPAERIAGELRRILCLTRRPSVAFAVLERTEQLEVLAPIAALRGIAQDPDWHPEGDVYVHTLMVLDRAAEIAERLAPEDREVLLLAALCHDLGKADTTRLENGRIRSIAHEKRSAEITREWLAWLRLPERIIRSVESLVAAHLAPAQFVAQGAGARAYRRLARRLAADDRSLVDLERLARADHLGRTTTDALAGRFDAGQSFLEAASAAQVREGIRVDVVAASDWMDRGIAPGPELGRLLSRCREIQDETGLDDVDRIIQRVLDAPSET